MFIMKYNIAKCKNDMLTVRMNQRLILKSAASASDGTLEVAGCGVPLQLRTRLPKPSPQRDSCAAEGLFFG